MSNDLEVRHCRVLLAVSEHCGIGPAARALGLAQSTVSETLLALERLIGTAVTWRHRGREAQLTTAAIALLPHARELVRASEAAMQAVSGDDGQVIRLGAVESASTYLLPRAIAAFRERWPTVAVQIAVGLCDDLRQRVQRGELDAAITLEAPASAPAQAECWNRVLSSTTLCLFVSARESPHRRATTRHDLSHRPLLLPDAAGAFNTLLRTWFASGGKQPRFESAGGVEGVKIGVRRSECVGVLARYAIARELAQGEFLDLRPQESLPVIALGVTTQRRPKAASALHDMVRYISDVF